MVFNKKLFTALTLGFSLSLTGCMSNHTSSASHVVNLGTILGSPSPIKGALQLKAFAPNIQDTRPHDDSVMPNSVVLLDKTFFTWGGFTSKARNKAICDGFVKLTSGQLVHLALLGKGKANEERRVLNYMLVDKPSMDFINKKEGNVDCDYLMSNYNYAEASKELDIILPGRKTNRSPYLAVYEPKNSPNTSMVLALGTLGAYEIEYLSENWERLLTAVYSKGKMIEDGDSAIYLAVMIAEDPKLRDAVKKNIMEKLKLVKATGVCGSSLIAAGATLSLHGFLSAATTSCQEVVKRARKEITGEA